MHCNQGNFRLDWGLFIVLFMQFILNPAQGLARENATQVAIEQLHQFNMKKPVLYSNIGMFTLNYKPEAKSYFINVVALDKSEKPQWIIRNLYIPDNTWIAREQAISARFYLDMLGYAPGEVVEGLLLAIDKSEEIWTEIPPEPIFAKFAVDTLRDDAQGDFTEIPPLTPKIGNYPIFPDFNKSDVILPLEFRGCRVPNIDLDDLHHPDTKEYAGDQFACGPASAANSLCWLDSAYAEIELPVTERDIMEELSALMKRSANNGVAIVDFIEGKLDFIEKYQLPINVKFQSSFFADDIISSSGLTLARNENTDKNDAYPTWEWLVKQMKSGEDVEMMYYWLDDDVWHGHAVVVTGVEEGNDGIKKSIKFKHDVWQGAAGGTKQEDESIYVDSYGRMVLRNRGAFIGNVVAESIGDPYPTPVELGLFTAYHIGRNVHLMWKTESESNNYGFELRRNDDKIAFIAGKGTTAEQHTYSYIDVGLKNGSYRYALIQIDFDGTRAVVGTSEVVVTEQPTEFALYQNYPNPFNATSTIKYVMPERGFVSIKIYNMLGEVLIDLVNQEKEAGVYTIRFDASHLANGIYFYRMETPGFSQIRKFLLIK